jgi:DNA-binding beta-propeller fold protein YncE
MIGQYADETVADPVPAYTKNIAHNGINRLGLNLSTTKINGMAYDNTNYRLFVSDTGNNRVLVYNTDEDSNLIDNIPDYVLGQSNFYTNSSGATSSTLNTPSGITYNTGSFLFVVDSGNNRVLVYDISSITNGEAAVNVLGQPDFTTVSAGTTAAKLSAPQGVAYDGASGNMYVADTGNNRVIIYDVSSITDGENAIHVAGQSDFTSSASANTQTGMNSPVDVVIESDNRLFVSQSGNNRVTVYDIGNDGITDGEAAVNVLGQANFTATSAANTQAGMNTPTALTFNGSSILYVAQSGNNRVTVYDITAITDGENAVSVLGQANFTATSAAVTQSGMSNPRGMIQINGGSDILYVLESGAHRIKRYDVSPIVDGENAIDLIGQYTDETLETLVPVYTKSGAHNAPNKLGLAGNASLVDSKNHRLFISDYNNNRVLVFNMDSSNLLLDHVPDYVLGQTNFYASAAATTAGGMSGPRDMAYDDANDYLYVVEEANNRVSIYDVASITNGENAVNVLGQTLFTTATANLTSSGFTGLRGIALDETNDKLYTVEADNHRVLVFDVSTITNGEAAVNVLGQSDFTTAATATTASRFVSPQGISFDEQNQRLIVADTFNYRILFFDVNSITDGEAAVNVLGQADFTSNTSTVTAHNFATPWDVTYDSVNDRIFVADFGGDRVMVYDTSSITNGEDAVYVLGQNTLSSLSCENCVTQSNVDAPLSVYYDSVSTRVYVSEDNNNRVMVFEVSPVTITNITSSTSNGTYTEGEVISIQVVFNDTMTVSGTPQLNLETGNIDRVASYTTGSGTNTLTFNYTVQAGDDSSDLDYINTTSLVLNGGSILDSSSNVANLTLPVRGASGSLGYNKNIRIYINPGAVILGSNGGGSASSVIITTSNTTLPTVTTPTTTPPTNSGSSTCPTLGEVPPVLKLKLTHQNVKTLQQLLNCKGYTVSTTGAGSLGKETTKFGLLTYKAVKAFQASKGIKVDGIVGVETRRELLK